MVDVVSVASYISERYHKEFGERIDEMKLHKLLYLTQRECLIQTGEPMFEAAFHAWRYGPVLPEIRQLYKADALKGDLPKEQEQKYKDVFDYVFAEYAHKRSFVLSNITHGDYSWSHAREGYGKYEDSDVPMLLDDIKKDADYFRQRRIMLRILEKSGLNKGKSRIFCGMRITEEQQKLLDGLRCERLSSDEMNLRQVDTFFNYRNDSIAGVLRNEAFSEDEHGSVAYYVVKDKNGEMLFFFSLKNGMLYDQHLDEKTIKLLKQLYDYLELLNADDDLTDEDRQVIEVVKEKVRSRKGLTRAELERIPKKNAKILEDLEHELNKNITHVGKTYSGVELVHFCANSAASGPWQSVGLPNGLGAIVFWQFVVPIVLKVREYVGCEYLFLFAADDSTDLTLVRHYKNMLGFVDEGERATAKPLYDLSCRFMYQDAETLAQRREEFFENFNAEA